jgi:glutathione S-transferase
MLTLYDYLDSGNGYKVRLLLAQLDRRYRRVELDITEGQTRTPEFLAKNPNGRIPMLELDNGVCLPESNAILWYLGLGSPFVPAEPLAQAQVLQWMFFEQYSHEPYIATSRFWLQHKPDSPERTAIIEARRDGGWAALKIMEAHLTKNDFFVGNYTTADIALFAYTHVSHEGGFPLDEFPKIRAWIERVKSQSGFISMTGQG